ncbi:MAG: hypothetical protein HZA93_09340 [Verrucomicrobia bacterium]|nr:hypothetical protein [Verrucomicrobiota bacterium]
MNAKKLSAGAFVLGGMGMTVFGLLEHQASRRTIEALMFANRRNSEMQERIAGLENSRAAAFARAEAAERDNAALTKAVQTTEAALNQAATAPVTREAFGIRVKQALALVTEGDPAAATRNLLWCFDTGVARPDLLAGVQMFSIVSALAKLGESDPTAVAALRERFENAKRRVLGSPDDTEPLSVMGTIARALKDSQAMVPVFDAIPASDPRRAKIAIYAADGLIADRRYAEAMIGRTYATMSANLESAMRDTVPASASAEVAERMRASMRSYAAKTAAINIEVLAGAGDLAHARELAARVLALDGSEATRALLQTHLERAGQPRLLANGP